MRKDLKHFNISESDWYVVAPDRDKWSRLCIPTPSLSELVQLWLFCDNCNWSIRRPQDMARHRCDSIRSRQTAAKRINSGIMCSICGRTLEDARICLDTSVYQLWMMVIIDWFCLLFSRAEIRHLPWWSSIQVQGLCVYVWFNALVIHIFVQFCNENC